MINTQHGCANWHLLFIWRCQFRKRKREPCTLIFFWRFFYTGLQYFMFYSIYIVISHWHYITSLFWSGIHCFFSINIRLVNHQHKLMGVCKNESFFDCPISFFFGLSYQTWCGLWSVVYDYVDWNIGLIDVIMYKVNIFPLLATCCKIINSVFDVFFLHFL